MAEDKQSRLVVTVNEAKGLVSPSGDAIEPYVVVTVDEEQDRTGAKQGPAAVWNTELTLPNNDDDSVTVEVFDKRGDVLVGGLTFLISELPDHVTDDGWYELRNKARAKVGQVNLTFGLKRRKARSRHSEKAGASEAGDVGDPKELSRAGGSTATLNEQARQRVSVRVVEAKGLPPGEVKAEGDPFAVVRVGQDSRRTAVVKQTLNPKWNEELRFAGDGTEDIEIEVRDAADRDSRIGRVVIPANEIDGEGNVTEQWYMLQPAGRERRKPVDLGRIYVSVQVTSKRRRRRSKSRENSKSGDETPEPSARGASRLDATGEGDGDGHRRRRHHGERSEDGRSPTAEVELERSAVRPLERSARENAAREAGMSPPRRVPPIVPPGSRLSGTLALKVLEAEDVRLDGGPAGRALQAVVRAGAEELFTDPQPADDPTWNHRFTVALRAVASFAVDVLELRQGTPPALVGTATVPLSSLEPGESREARHELCDARGRDTGGRIVLRTLYTPDESLNASLDREAQQQRRQSPQRERPDQDPRSEQERLDRLRADRARLERMEAERDRVRSEVARAERERNERESRERERVERERQERERSGRERELLRDADNKSLDKRRLQEILLEERAAKTKAQRDLEMVQASLVREREQRQKLEEELQAARKHAGSPIKMEQFGGVVIGSSDLLTRQDLSGVETSVVELANPFAPIPFHVDPFAPVTTFATGGMVESVAVAPIDIGLGVQTPAYNYMLAPMQGPMQVMAPTPTRAPIPGPYPYAMFPAPGSMPFPGMPMPNGMAPDPMQVPTMAPMMLGQGMTPVLPLNSAIQRAGDLAVMSAGARVMPKRRQQSKKPMMMF